MTIKEDDKRALIDYKIERSVETIKTAENNLNLGDLYSAVNRIYYACFYAVSALLLTKNLPSKTHNGTKQLFGKYFIKEGIIDKEYGRFYNQILESRQESDYGSSPIKFSKEEVESNLHKGKVFIEEIDKLTAKLMNENKNDL